MKLEEAKICLSIQLEIKHRLGKDYEAHALQLGIEALNRVLTGRNFGLPFEIELLPGETKD